MKREAMSRYFDLIDTGDAASVRVELNMWLSQNPAHGLAWTRAQQIARLTAAYLRATELGADKGQLETFVSAIVEERRLYEQLSEPLRTSGLCRSRPRS